MGLYINPHDMSKEEWLNHYGTEVLYPPTNFREGNKLLCILVDNGGFTAAAICFNDGERLAFTRPSDPRPKQYFMVPINDLKIAGFLKEEFLNEPSYRGRPPQDESPEMTAALAVGVAAAIVLTSDPVEASTPEPSPSPDSFSSGGGDFGGGGSDSSY